MKRIPWYEDATRLAGRKVKVHRNLHRKCWSISEGGKVIAHAARVSLSDVTFLVSEAGRQRVLHERRKHVHAYAFGKVALFPLAWNQRNPKVWARAGYNPYKAGTFTTEAGPISGAREALFLSCGNLLVTP